MNRKLFFTIGALLILASGCVPPETPSPPRCVRVAVLEEAKTLTLSSRSTLTVRDARSGKALLRSAHATPITIASSPQGVSIAGKTHPAETLRIESTSNEIALNGKTYPGSLKILCQHNGLLAVNFVDLGTYLKAVVPSEMLPSWPQEALKAQAVVSRSFVLHHAFKNRHKDYDIASSTQVYNPDKRDPRTDKAVDATRNIVLFYKGNLLLPFFSTCCGGFTEHASNVWEAADAFPPPVECPFCRDAPDYHWRARMTLKDFQIKLRSAGIDSARSLAVYRRSTAGHRITALNVQSETGDTVLKINRFRMIMGPNVIKSGFFDFEVKDGYITFTGHGWGHGVGMCQRGAKALADRGESFKSILRYYFPAARTRKMSW